MNLIHLICHHFRIQAVISICSFLCLHRLCWSQVED
ncbi:unnamed protein product [Brassica oleracea]